MLTDKPVHSRSYCRQRWALLGRKRLALRAEGLTSGWYSDAVMGEDLAPLVRYFEEYNRK